jgi:uncharacterized protein YhaN
MGYASYQESINDHRVVVSGLLEELQRLEHSQQRKRAEAAGHGAHVAAIEGAAKRALAESRAMCDDFDRILAYVTQPGLNVALDNLALRQRVADLLGEKDELLIRNADLERLQEAHADQVRVLQLRNNSLNKELKAAKQVEMSDRELDKLINKKKSRP